MYHSVLFRISPKRWHLGVQVLGDQLSECSSAPVVAFSESIKAANLTCKRHRQLSVAREHPALQQLAAIIRLFRGPCMVEQPLMSFVLSGSGTATLAGRSEHLSLASASSLAATVVSVGPSCCVSPVRLAWLAVCRTSLASVVCVPCPHSTHTSTDQKWMS